MTTKLLTSHSPFCFAFIIASLLTFGCSREDASAFFVSEYPVAVCDLHDDDASSGIEAVLNRNKISYSSSEFDEKSENAICLYYVADSEMELTAKLIETDAEKLGYKVTVHFGGDTPSRWINHD